MKSIDLPDDIADLLEKVPAAERGAFLRAHGFRYEPAGNPENGAAAIDPHEMYRLFTDGAARGNPGEAGAGFAIQDEENTTLYQGKKYLGEMTNNLAEWTALLLGLKQAAKMGIRNLTCFLDSELVVKQMKGEYKVKHPELQPMFKQAKLLAFEFPKLSFIHIPREKNTLADRLSNQAIDAKAI